MGATINNKSTIADIVKKWDSLSDKDKHEFLQNTMLIDEVGVTLTLYSKFTNEEWVSAIGNVTTNNTINTMSWGFGNCWEVKKDTSLLNRMIIAIVDGEQASVLIDIIQDFTTGMMHHSELIMWAFEKLINSYPASGSKFVNHLLNNMSGETARSKTYQELMILWFKNHESDKTSPLFDMIARSTQSGIEALKSLNISSIGLYKATKISAFAPLAIKKIFLQK